MFPVQGPAVAFRAVDSHGAEGSSGVPPDPAFTTHPTHPVRMQNALGNQGLTATTWRRPIRIKPNKSA